MSLEEANEFRQALEGVQIFSRFFRGFDDEEIDSLTEVFTAQYVDANETL